MPTESTADSYIITVDSDDDGNGNFVVVHDGDDNKVVFTAANDQVLTIGKYGGEIERAGVVDFQTDDSSLVEFFAGASIKSNITQAGVGRFDTNGVNLAMPAGAPTGSAAGATRLATVTGNRRVYAHCGAAGWMWVNLT